MAVTDKIFSDELKDWMAANPECVACILHMLFRAKHAGHQKRAHSEIPLATISVLGLGTIAGFLISESVLVIGHISA